MDAQLSTNAKTGDWDEHILAEMMATEYVEAVVLTDKTGKVLHAQLRRPMPDHLGELTEVIVGLQSRAGAHFGLDQLRIATNVYESGVMICGAGLHHHVLVLASKTANLGQLLNHTRRLIPYPPV